MTTFTLADLKEALSNVKALKSGSVRTYASHISLFSRENKQPNIKLLLNNYKAMDKYIQEKKKKGTTQDIKLKTKQSYYITLKAMGDHLNFITQEAKNFYTKRQNEYNQLASRKSGENEAPERFPDGLPPWSDVAELHKEFDNGSKYGANHLLVALYTLIPPRRGDYRTLVYLADTPKFDPKVPDKKRDTLVRDTKGNPYNFIYPKGDSYEMVLTQYKTNGRYGVYRTQLPKALGDIIKGYINKQHIGDNTVVFRTTTKPTVAGKYNPVQANSFPNKVSNAFAVKYNKHKLTLGNLRHMYITSNVKGSMTTNKKQDIADKMAHSIGMQDRYRQHRTLDTVESDDEGDDDEVHQPTPQEDPEPSTTTEDTATTNETEDTEDTSGPIEEQASQSDDESLESLYARLGKAVMEVDALKVLIRAKLSR
jgi:hypothetical protein